MESSFTQKKRKREFGRVRFPLRPQIISKTKEITKTIYISDDGKEFLTEAECKKHEKFVKDILRNISYFCIRCDPDLNETGSYMHKIYVMGYGFQPHFNVSEVSKEEYEECHATVWGGTPLKSEKIFLSPKQVEGFPKNIDYMKEWGFK